MDPCPGRLEVTESGTRGRRRGLRIDTEPAAVLCQEVPPATRKTGGKGVLAEDGGLRETLTERTGNLSSLSPQHSSPGAANLIFYFAKVGGKVVVLLGQHRLVLPVQPREPRPQLLSLGELMLSASLRKLPVVFV